ncbi:YrzI family small protein [Alteribacter aurantiacus]|nr:YrzI family small protein [Alteribacter aurantiacus]
MLFTLFHYTVTVEKEPYTDDEVEREWNYEQMYNQVMKERAEHTKYVRLM